MNSYCDGCGSWISSYGHICSLKLQKDKATELLEERLNSLPSYISVRPAIELAFLVNETAYRNMNVSAVAEQLAKDAYEELPTHIKNWAKPPESGHDPAKPQTITLDGQTIPVILSLEVNGPVLVPMHEIEIQDVSIEGMTMVVKYKVTKKT